MLVIAYSDVHETGCPGSPKLSSVRAGLMLSSVTNTKRCIQTRFKYPKALLRIEIIDRIYYYCIQCIQNIHVICFWCGFVIPITARFIRLYSCMFCTCRSVEDGPVSLSRCSCCEVRSPSSWTSSSPTPRGTNLCPSAAFSSHIDLCLGPLSSDWQEPSAGEAS